MQGLTENSRNPTSYPISSILTSNDGKIACVQAKRPLTKQKMSSQNCVRTFSTKLCLRGINVGLVLKFLQTIFVFPVGVKKNLFGVATNWGHAIKIELQSTRLVFNN